MDPDDWTGLRALGHRILDDMIDVIAGVRDRPVWTKMPDALRQELQSPRPRAPETPEAVFAAVQRLVVPYVTGNLYPGFMGWVHGGGNPVVRDGTMQAATFAQSVAYLRREERGLAGGHPWPCDLGPELSRGFRALKVWMTLKTYGADRLGQVVEASCAVAQHLAGRIRSEPALELLAPVALNIVCFRVRAGGDADALNRDIVADLQEAGIAALSTTTIDGKLAIRAAIVNHRTRTTDADAMLDAVLERAARRTRTSPPGVRHG